MGLGSGIKLQATSYKLQATSYKRLTGGPGHDRMNLERKKTYD